MWQWHCRKCKKKKKKKNLFWQLWQSHCRKCKKKKKNWQFRQWDCHNCQYIYIYIYFFYIFGNGIATIAKIFIYLFIFTFSTMPLPQLICHKFFEIIIINHVWFIVKILCTWQLFFLLIHRFHNFFFLHFRQCHCHN